MSFANATNSQQHKRVYPSVKAEQLIWLTEHTTTVTVLCNPLHSFHLTQAQEWQYTHIHTQHYTQMQHNAPL